MSWTLQFHPAVPLEVEAVELWHEMKKPGMGDDFRNDFHEVLGRIREHPEHFAIGIGDIRLAMFKKFSYVVRFRKMKDRVRIVSVKHTSQSSGDWLARH